MGKSINIDNPRLQILMRMKHTSLSHKRVHYSAGKFYGTGLSSEGENCVSEEIANKGTNSSSYCRHLIYN
jgi:hypothetical protein